MNPDPNPNPNPNNPNNLLDTIILLGYNVRMGCKFQKTVVNFSLVFTTVFQNYATTYQKRYSFECQFYATCTAKNSRRKQEIFYEPNESRFTNEYKLETISS